ncbi:Uncharacterised protein [uncultured archaeon]|nr:Uncharacterised protein [uncultured archaeon]
MTVLEIHRLQPWEEARGPLQELQEQDGCLVARIGPAVVALPDELREKLQGLMGKTVGILRTDFDYRLMVLED